MFSTHIICYPTIFLSRFLEELLKCRRPTQRRPDHFTTARILICPTLDADNREGKPRYHWALKILLRGANISKYLFIATVYAGACLGVLTKWLKLQAFR